MIVVAIDGKLTGSGYAIGDGATLLAAGAAVTPKGMRKLEDRAHHQIATIRGELAGRTALTMMGRLYANEVVAELPRVYPGDANKADPNDLVDLAALTLGIAYAIAGPYGRVFAPTPRRWKGTIDKAHHHKRLAAAHPLAVPIVNETTPYRRHDVWDAVGLYYWRVCAEGSPAPRRDVGLGVRRVGR